MDECGRRNEGNDSGEEAKGREDCLVLQRVFCFAFELDFVGPLALVYFLAERQKSRGGGATLFTVDDILPRSRK